jgi:hypothetical protein
MKHNRALTLIGLPVCLCLLAGSAWAISRTEIVEGAPAFEEHTWDCAAVNLEACAGTSWQPAVTEVGAQVGLPYCWGGWVTIEKFDAQIAQGYGPGSLPEGYHPTCTTGLDCSGYVSQLWQHPIKLGTATIPEVSAEIDLTEMRPGDVFNDAGSHVIMFLGEDVNGDAIVTEATTGTCLGVCRRARPWSVFDGYIPRAYDFAEMQSSTQAGSGDDLIQIDSFPYHDGRSTTGAPSDVFDFYATALQTDESGPELIYVFDVLSGGTLTARVADAVGVDIDIHLLSALDANSCLARNDWQIRYEITSPGTYYLVADTFVGRTGAEYSGAYLLTADFTGELGKTDDEEPESGGCGCGFAGKHRTGLPLSGLLLVAAIWIGRRRRS